MRSLLLTGVVALAALFCAAPANAAYENLLAPASQCAPQTDRAASAAQQTAAMRCMVNFARKAAGVSPLLATNTKLNTSAQRKADDILRCQQFSHTACGRPFAFHMQQARYATGCHGVAENIAWGSGSYGSVRSIMSGWLNSAGHRANILNARMREQGIGLVTGTMSGYRGAAVWVNHFGYRC
jgi:uncharacterized protein YkwD